jgi:hypothetical protein
MSSMPLKCSLFYVNLEIALAVLGRRMSQTSRRPSASAARLAAVGSRVQAAQMLFFRPGDTGLQASLGLCCTTADANTVR